MLNEGEGDRGQNVLDYVFDTTAEGASHTDLEGKQLNDSRVGAETNDEIKQNPGYAQVIKNNQLLGVPIMRNIPIPLTIKNLARKVILGAGQIGGCDERSSL